jgi:membrane protein required for colicin V production
VTLFDYVVIFIIVCSVVISTMRGLVKEILSLISWIVALVVANTYGETVASWLPDVIPGNLSRMIVGFLALFIAVRLLMALLMHAFDAVIKASGLSLADRGLGGLFGLARGCVLVMTLALVCGMTAIPQQAFWKNALLSPVTEVAIKTVMPFLPGSVTKHVKF